MQCIIARIGQTLMRCGTYDGGARFRSATGTLLLVLFAICYTGSTCQAVETQVKVLDCDEAKGVICGRCNTLESTLIVDWVQGLFTLSIKCLSCVKGDTKPEETKMISGTTTQKAPLLTGMDFSGLCTTGISKFGLIVILSTISFLLLVSSFVGFLLWRNRRKRLKQEQLKAQQELEAKARIEKKERKRKELQEALERQDHPDPLLDEANNHTRKEPTDRTSKDDFSENSLLRKSGVLLKPNDLLAPNFAASLELNPALQEEAAQLEAQNLSIDGSQMSANSISQQKSSSKSKTRLARRPIRKVTKNSTSKLHD